jgi:hypothetical protein
MGQSMRGMAHRITVRTTDTTGASVTQRVAVKLAR